MSKKVIIISIISVALVAVVTITAFLLIKGNNTQSDNGAKRTPGETVALSDTPDLKTCEVVSVASIKDALDEAGETLSAGERSGIVGHNGEAADSCRYTFTNRDTDSTLALEVYPYTNSDGNESAVGNVFDSSWLNINKAQFPPYTLTYPAYFKAADEGTDTTFTFHVITGVRHYQFTITQPKGEDGYTRESVIPVLISLAIKANYEISGDQDAPPAPVTSTETEESTPEVRPDDYGLDQNN